MCVFCSFCTSWLVSLAPPESFWHLCTCEICFMWFSSLWTHTLLHSGFLFMKKRAEHQGRNAGRDWLAHTEGVNRWGCRHLASPGGSRPGQDTCAVLCLFSLLQVDLFQVSQVLQIHSAQVQSLWEEEARQIVVRWASCTNFKYIYNNKQSMIHKMWYLQLLQRRCSVTAAEWVKTIHIVCVKRSS